MLGKYVKLAHLLFNQGHLGTISWRSPCLHVHAPLEGLAAVNCHHLLDIISIPSLISQSFCMGKASNLQDAQIEWPTVIVDDGLADPEKHLCHI